MRAPRHLVAIDPRTTAVAAAVGAAIVILVSVPLAVVLNIWIDEAFTLHTTGAGLKYALAQAISFEAQPPAYFVIEAVWRTVNESSIAFARLPSVFFAAASVVIIVVAAHRLAPGIPSLGVALVTALNPLLIWTAVEMRVYALILLVSAILAWTFLAGFLENPTSRRAQFWYGVFSIVGLYTQYYIGFVLVAHALTLIFLRRATLRAYIVIIAIVSLAFAPFLGVARMHVAQSGAFVSQGTLVTAVHEIVNVVFSFVLPHDIDWSGIFKIVGFVSATALVVAVIVIGRPSLQGRVALAFSAQWLIMLAIFSIIFCVSGIPLDPRRHLVAIAPSSLLVGYQLIAMLTQRRKFLGGFAALTFAAFAGSALWTLYRPPLMKLGDWKRVAATVAADDRDTPIAVFPAEAALPLGRYLAVKTIPIPRPMPFTVDYVRATRLKSEPEVAAELDPLWTHSSRLWVITTSICKSLTANNYNYNCQYLEAYLRQRYRLENSHVFHGAVARLFVVARSKDRQ